MGLKLRNVTQLAAALILTAANIGFATCSAEAQRRSAETRTVGNMRITDASSGLQARLEINKSMIIELPQDAKDILISNPTIANAIVRTPRRIFVIGVGVGSTNVVFFDGNGGQIASIDIVVERDLEALNRTLRRLFPSTNVRAEGIGENVVVSGQVNSAADAAMAIQVAERFVGQLSGSAQAQSTGGTGQAANSSGAPSGQTQGTNTGASAVGSGGTRIVNALTIAGKDQVQLRVVVAEVDRRAMRQLGVNFGGSIRFGSNTISFQQVNPFPANQTNQAPFPIASPTPGLPSAFSTGGILEGLTNSPSASVAAQIRAMEQTGLIRTLAEPSLTAISGESASFLAGGEFPIPVSRDRDGNIILEYKQFGVGLGFTPIVLSEGRISVRMRAEVSEIDPSAGFQGVGGFVIPGLAVRRADSTVELPSGGTLVVAGLIRDQTRHAISGVPGLRRLPILGRLFSSSDFLSNQSELVILVTPYIVNPVSRRELSLPTDGFVNASDPERILFNRMNRIYGVRGQQAPAERPHGRFGFIYE
jgi:pilus assembly protein CpaC